MITKNNYEDFSLLTNPDNLYAAFKKCCKGVAWKKSTQQYKINLFSNILETMKKLKNGESVSKGFVEFDIVDRGRKRHIKSVHISERIVQRCFCDEILTPIIEKSLIYDNYACQKNKGTHFAIKRFLYHLSKFYRQNKSNNGYCLSIDFSKYFDNISHEVLFNMISKYIINEEILKLIRNFIEIFGEKSLGVGSQISQIMAIFYSSKIDHFIKEVLKIKYYGRYMDDLFLFHKDKKFLEFCLDKIEIMCSDLKIIINRKKTKIVKLKYGVLFLKGTYILKNNGKIIKLPDKKSPVKMRKKLRKYRKLVDQKKMTYRDVYVSYQSWRNYNLKLFNSFNIVKEMDNFYNKLFI